MTLADGRVLTGVLAQSEFDATLLAEGKFYLLARDGAVYREKPIEPKSDWLTYGGSPGAGRYRALDQIDLWQRESSWRRLDASDVELAAARGDAGRRLTA